MVDGYVGAPMLSALLGVYAARLGKRDRALELYERGFADYVLRPHLLTAEYSHPGTDGVRSGEHRLS